MIVLWGYLVERRVRGCASWIGRLFSLSGLPMAPFLFENWFRYRSRFCKKLQYIFDQFFLWFTYRLSKSDLCIPIYMVKRTDWFNKGPFNFRKKWFRHRFQIFVFSGLVIGWWLKLWAGHSYPTQIWVRPRNHGILLTALLLHADEPR